MRIAYLPLDSRPCNWRFPVQLAAWAGVECVVPPMESMDCFTVPADFQSARAFLLREAPLADALVVSIDQLCFGSLLASREMRVPAEEALSRLAFLEELHAQRPDLPIHAYSVLMRSSISALCRGDLAAYQAMTEYSVQSGKAEQENDAQAAALARQARERLPVGLAERYHTLRGRNHAVNRRCVELAAAGVFASLAILQEDSQPYGFHKKEQRALISLRDVLAAPNVFLRNGADEGGMLAVMKAAAECALRPPLSLRLRWLGEGRENFTALYEDRPFSQNVENSLAYAGMQANERAKDVLVICLPPDGRQTDGGAPDAAPPAPYVQALQSLLREDARIYLLDILRANGGSLELIKALGDPMRLAGYSAWNTASNSLGTILAQILSDSLAGRINRTFLRERLLDDLLYQSAVRPKLSHALSERGEDIFHLKDRPAAESLLREQFSAYLAQSDAFAFLSGCTVSLPWDRIFEADIRAAP